jgi:prepilin-type N-terminal cleavage/methylation domain-containing protein/prepilin-type processing-associated H-X9-DG protein
MKRRGFTLIELLVVIAIIAILAAILFPVFARAREKARQTSCLSNIKQITLAVHMYAQDYDETMPLALAGTPGVTSYFMFSELLDPYIKNEQVWDCPSKQASVDLSQIGKTSVSYMVDVGTRVPSNSSTGSIFGAPALGYYSCTLSQLAEPATIAIMADAIGLVDAAFDVNIEEHPRHNDGCNYGFADGHAKWDRPENVAISLD